MNLYEEVSIQNKKMLKKKSESPSYSFKMNIVVMLALN